MEDGNLNIDGINIAFARRGKGEPLVLIHGYPLDRSIWNPVTELLEGDYDLIIPDLRGFGQSDALEADRSMMTYASDLAGLLDRIKLRKAHVVGHSMGGYVALAFVRMYPERVLGLGLLASQAAEDTPERKAARQSAARKIMAEGVGTVADVMVPQLTHSEPIRTALRDVISRQQPLGLSCALEAMAGRPDSMELFRSLELPVVIIHGEADKLIPIERGREMQTLLPSARYVELAGGGHMPMMENAEAVAEAIRFLHDATTKSIKMLDG